MEKIYADPSMHNIGGTVRMKGKVDFELLERAIHVVVKKTEGIRHRFTELDEEIQQYVGEVQRFSIRFVDFSSYPHSEEKFAAWVRQEAEKPFQLYDNDLFDFALFKIGDHDNGYLIKVHHIVTDGWSMNILVQQICDTYLKLLRGEPITDKQNESYISRIHQEQNYLGSDRFLKNKRFWNEKFATLPEKMNNKGLDCAEGKRETYCLSSGQSNRIKEFATMHQSSVYAFFVALYLVYLYKMTHHADQIIGMPVFNRSGKKEKNTVGMMTSTMPFRFQMDGEMSIQQLVEEVNRELKLCYFHQKYPFDLLVKDLELNKKGYGDLFHTCINYYNTHLVSELDGMPIENEEFYNGKQMYSLQLIIREWSRENEFQLDIDYKVQEYTSEQIEQMYQSLIYLIDQILLFPERKLCEFSLISEDEQNKLIYEFNSTDTDYPKHKTITQLFEEQVASTPDQIAVCLDQEELTYRQLNERANQLARSLVKRNVKQGVLVGISTRHSMESIIGILGILKAGGAYLPIDPDYPADRIDYMLQDSGISLLLTNVSMVENIPRFTGEVIDLNSTDLYMEDIANLEAISSPSDLAYVIYTSGSTGIPKGTMVEHRGLVNYTWWAQQVYLGSNEVEVFPFYSSLSFDLTVTSIFTPLISGNQIIIYPDDEHEYVLYRICREGKVSIMKLTPSHLSLLQDVDLSTSSIKKLIVGGEDLKVSLARSIHDCFGGQVTIFNEYGPTEAVVGCMIHRYDIEKDRGTSVPIGIPAQNTKIYVLDPDLSPVPLGQVGEIYISGDGVARGYLNKQELTEERFVRNPFVNRTRMYRTGDLARFIDGKKLEYLGRADTQVKIRGHRIELGEIEKGLLNHPSIKEAVVVEREHEKGSKYLCAYYTEHQKVSPIQLSIFLTSFLPEYMIPPYLVEVSHIPLTINGKVDIRALPEPKVKISDVHDFNADVTELERILLQQISQVLNVNQVSLHDNFYHLGGDSIKAIQLSSKLSMEGLKIKSKDILANPVIGNMVLYINASGNGKSENDSPCEGMIKPLPATSWFFAQNLSDIQHYTQSVLLDIREEIKKELLEQALNKLVEHHDAFRLNVTAPNGELFYNPKHLRKKLEIEVVDLSGYPHSEQLDRIAKIGEIIKSSFNIENDILLKACLFQLGEQEQRFLMTAHHLAVDGVSWRIIIEDMNRIYEDLHKSGIAVLPQKTSSVQDFAMELDQYSLGISDEEKKYWNQVHELHTVPWNDFDLGTDRIEYCETLIEKLTEEETDQLIFKANDAYRTRADELMLIALAIVIKDYAQTQDVIIEVEGHGREEIADHIDVSRTVGWFTSLYPTLLVVENRDISSQIKTLKDQLRSIPHHGFNYGILKYISRELNGDSQKHVRFNYLGDFHASFTSGIFEFAEEYSGREIGPSNEMDCLLEIVVYTVNKKLYLSIKYSQNKFKKETISQFLKSYMDQLRLVIRHCCDQDDTEFTPSDFETTSLSSEELDDLFND